MWRLVTKPRITLHFLRSNSGRFSKHCSAIYVGETMSIFLCFTLNSRHCPPIYLHKKRYSALHWNVSPYRPVHAPATDQLLFPRTASCERRSYIYIYTSWCMSLAAMKTSLTWVGIDPASYFTYLELKSLN